MGRFKNILVAASPGHLGTKAMRSAIAFAVGNQAHLTVVDVVERLPAWRRSVGVEGRTIDLQDLMCRDQTKQLRQFVDMTGGTAEVKVEVKMGKPAVEIIRHVLRNGCDLVMVGEHRPSRDRAPGLSSGVMQLLRKCPVPVWVVRPTQAKTVRVLALVDPDPSDPIRDGLNDLVLGLAASMVRLADGELHVAHAWELPGEATLRSSSCAGLPGTEIDLILQATHDAHLERLSALTGRHGIEDLGERLHLVHGDPELVIPPLAKRLKTNLIVMGTVGRTGLSGFIMGNTAETVLRSVECSVLAVKPEGFVSPVRLGDRQERSRS